MREKNPSQHAELGNKIRALRTNAGLTQKQLEKKCGVSMRTIIRIESGEIAATLNSILAFAHAFEITASDLLEGIKKESPKKKKTK